MNKQLNSDIDRYIKDIKSFLICDYKTQKKFIGDFKNDIFSYIEDNSISDIDKISEHFGTPQEIAKGFFENADTKKIKKKMNISRIIMICIIAALLIWIVGVTAAVIDAHPSNDGYFVDESYDISEELVLDLYQETEQ